MLGRGKLVIVSESALPRAYRWVRGLLDRGRGAGVAVSPEGGGLVVVAAGYDDVESCSAALERAAGGDPAWDAGRQALLRHPMVVPASAVPEIEAVGAQEGYQAVAADPGVPASAVGAVGADEVLLILARSQLLDALHCSQERSRMAGLAQRHGGRAVGWDALQPDPESGRGR